MFPGWCTVSNRFAISEFHTSITAPTAGALGEALVVSPGKRYHFQNAAESYHKNGTGYEISLTDIARHVAKRMRDLERN